MSTTPQKMFARAGFALVVAVLAFAQAVPVPGPEEVHPVEYGQFVSTGVMQSDGEPPAMFVRESMLGPDAIAAVQQQQQQEQQAVVRPTRSAIPFFDLFSGYEKPHRTHHHHHHHHEEQEPEYHRPQHYKPQHHYGGGSAGSFASAGSFSGGHGGGQSQSAANSHSASFGFGPFQASYSASSAHAGSHSGGDRGFSDYNEY